MPQEPAQGAGTARQMIEAASAFAGREMLAEARDALQSARAALALRSDVGPAHWCDACLVALEIAARDGDMREMETEAARLRSLSGGGRYWTEQARARIGGHAGRVEPAHLDHVVAILAGEATPAAPRSEPPRIPEQEYTIGSDCSPREPSADPLLATVPRNHPAQEPGARWTERLPNPVADLPSILVDETRGARPVTTSRSAADHFTADLTTAALEPAALPFPDAPLPPMLARPIGVAPLTRYDGLRHRRMALARSGILVVLALGSALGIYRSIASQGGYPTLSGPPTPQHEPQPREAPAAFASLRHGEGRTIPHGHLVRGQSLLATGDTVGAVTALSAAARSDSRGDVAWAAAETLARLPGRSARAADAYLLAFAAGLSADHAETVARAQELAGRPDRARRVRQQAAAH